MPPEVTLIAQSVVDWHAFVPTINRLLGRSPTRQLDAHGLPVGPPLSFIAALGELEKPDQNPIKVVQDGEEILNFLSYTFLISCDHDVYFQLLKIGTGKLNFLTTDPNKHRENFIVTGTLLAWRTVIAKSCQKESEQDVRYLASMIWEFFNNLGFKEIFGKYHRKALPDRTFYLENRS